MANQLLWLETLLKGGIGLVMLFAPITMAKLAGLPHGNTGLWPRLFGAALLGIAAACALEGYSHYSANLNVRGLGLGGIVVINLITVLSLLGVLIFKGVASVRGKLLLWTMSVILTFLMMFQLAHA